MNFQTILEELDRLYEEENVKKENEKTEDTATETEQELAEAAEDISDEEEIIDDEIIDDEEPAADELKQLILECDKCGALVIKAEEDVKIDDATDLANVDEVCHFCEEAAGCKIIGIVAPYEVAEDAEPVEDEIEEEDIVEESLANNSVEESDEELTELLDFDVPISASVNIKADGNNVPFLNTALEELDTATDEGDNVELEEGIFDSKRKSKPEYRNNLREFESQVKQIAGDSLNNIAYSMAGLALKAITEYRIKYKDNDKPYQTHDNSLSKVFESKAKEILKLYEESIKQLKKPANFTAPGYVIYRMINSILGSFAAGSDALDDIDEYRQALQKINNIEVEKKLGQDILNSFSEKVIYRLQQDLNLLKKRNAWTLFEEVEIKEENEELEELQMQI